MFDITDIQRIQKNSRCLISEKEIHQAMDRMAKEMTEVLGDKMPLFLCTMQGALIFMGQLLPKLPFLLQIDYVHTSRYKGGTQAGELCWMAKPTTSLENRTVVLIEDILDTGGTLKALIDDCYKQKAKKVYTAVLLDKNHPREKGGLEKTDFTGFKVDDIFLIGYGLDYQGFLRNLPGIYAVEVE